MQTTGIRIRDLARIGILTGVAVACSHLVAHAGGTPLVVRHSKDAGQPASNRAPLMSPGFIDSLIDVAMRDGMLDRSEREMIMGQAERGLTPRQVADLTARLNSLPTSTAARVQLGQPVAIGADTSAAATINTISLEEPAQEEPVPAPRVAAKPAASGGAASSCSKKCGVDSCSSCLLDNFYVFSVVDAWRGPLDGNQSNNFGGRIGFNGGVPLVRACGIGAQMGMSYGAYDAHGRFDLAAETETSAVEEQWFFTTGVFKHCNLSNACQPDRVSWGVVYDRMITDNTSAATAELSIGQFRGQIGYACNETREVGLWGSISDGSDESFSAIGAKHTTRSIDQLNMYCRRIWSTGADTRAFIGIAEEPGSFVVGANGQLPLNDSWAVFSGFEYILPSTSGGPPGFRDEIWNVSAGIAFYPGGGAIRKSVCGPSWQPLLPVADNGSFALDLGF